MNHSTTKFENPFKNIFLTTYAQSSDVVVSPTLPVDPNLVGPLFESNNTGATASLVSSTTQIRIGDKFESELKIETGNQILSSFKITFQYDPAFFLYQSDSVLKGEFEEIVDITIDETTGVITIEGTIGSDAIKINDSLIKFEFRSIKSGSTSINIVPQDSYLNTPNGENILAKSISVDLEILGSSATIVTPTPLITQIPKSNLSDPGNIWGLIVGILAIVLGVWASMTARNKKEHGY